VLPEGQGLRTVFFDGEAAAAQAGKGLAPADYAAAQRLIDTGVETGTSGGGLQYVGEVDGRSWCLEIEPRDGRIRLLSLSQVQ
jgi:hypothetical protein